MNIPSLFKTIDGGFIWTEIDLPGQEGELQDVYFYDNKEGVVVIRDLMNMVNPSMIFKTLDDGETWEDISP